jgi:hypothetical protein
MDLAAKPPYHATRMQELLGSLLVCRSVEEWETAAGLNPAAIGSKSVSKDQLQAVLALLCSVHSERNGKTICPTG